MLLLQQLAAILILLRVSQCFDSNSGEWPANSGADQSNSSNTETYQLPPEVLANDLSQCVEDRIEAAEAGRQCSRRCKKDAPCENLRKQCLCDGLCGMSCIRPDLQCAELPKIANGDYQPKVAKFNTRIVYQCEPGYYLFGSRERLCQGDEDWSGAPAECLPEPMCKSALKVNHARNPNDATYRLYDKVNYSCYPGYQSRGSPEAVCKLLAKNQTGWLWSGAPFRCIPKSCGDPGQISNGKRHGDSFIIASSILYTCNEGFEMIGQARRYCQSDSLWSGQPPECKPVVCNPTDHLENGRIDYVYPLIYNSTVEYKCDYGFKLVGQAKRLCGADRRLGGEPPACVEIDCGQLGPLANGHIRGSGSRMGDKKQFVCADGMKFVGEARESVCTETGEWSRALPQCLGPCVVPNVERASRIYVIQPDLLANTISSDKNYQFKVNASEVGSIASHGSYIELTCEHEYEFDEQMNESNVIQAPVCVNSTWSYGPRCRPASCKHAPPSPKNGRARVASIEHGSIGYFHCLDGFRLRGSNSTECIKGNWTPTDAQCTEIYCSFPGNIGNGRVLLVGLNGMYDYKPYIKRISTNRQIAYECDSGYRLKEGAPNGATCMDGSWRPEGLPTCSKE